MVRCLIIYFSASGNTKYGVQLIKRGIESSGTDTCDMVTVNEFTSGMEKQYDLLGFASPVFAFKPSLNMLDLVDRLPDGGNRPCFTFFTLGGDGVNAAHTLQTRLSRKGYAVVAHHEMPAEDSWTTIRFPKIVPSMSGHPNQDEQQAVIAFGSALANRLQEYEAGRLQPVKTRFRWNLLHLVSYFFTYPFLSRFFVTRVNPDKCTRCGLCVRRCSTGRMDFARFPNPKGKCIGCYGCINACPEQAIEGWLTRGKIRYKGIPDAERI